MRFIVETFPIFSISNDLLQLLTSWKKQQKYELAKFGIISNPEQFIFTYIDKNYQKTTPRAYTRYATQTTSYRSNAR